MLYLLLVLQCSGRTAQVDKSAPFYIDSIEKKYIFANMERKSKSKSISMLLANETWLDLELIAGQKGYEEMSPFLRTILKDYVNNYDQAMLEYWRNGAKNIAKNRKAK